MRGFLQRILPIVLPYGCVVTARGNPTIPSQPAVEHEITCYQIGSTIVEDGGECITFTSVFECGCRVQLGVISDCLKCHFCISIACRGPIGITLDQFCG